MATHISRHFHASGLRIDAIWSRSAERAEKLAKELGCGWSIDPARLPQNSSFYLMAVSDNAVGELAGKFRGRKGIWIHCAGALDLDVLGVFKRYGVLYPLQTITRERELTLKEVPFLIEGGDRETLEEIRELALLLSDRVEEMDSRGRLVLHLAAVFANNFSNHMMRIAQEILHDKNIDFTLLEPLLRETFMKAIELGPQKSQTGPAARGDRIAMEKHLELLKGYPEWEKMYTFMSQEIQKSRNDEF